jgi:hypothetical protein
MATAIKTLAEFETLPAIVSFLNREERDNFSKCCRNYFDLIGKYNELSVTELKGYVRENFKNAIFQFGLEYETLMRHLKTVYGVIGDSVLLGCIGNKKLPETTIKIIFPVNNMSMLLRQVKYSGIAVMLEECKFEQLHRSSSRFCIIFQNNKFQEVRIFGVEIGDSAVQNLSDWASGEKCFVGNVYGPLLVFGCGSRDDNYSGDIDYNNDEDSDYDKINGQMDSGFDVNRNRDIDSGSEDNDSKYGDEDSDYDNGQMESGNDESHNESDDESNDVRFRCVDSIDDNVNGNVITVKYCFYCTNVARTIDQAGSESYSRSLQVVIKQNENRRKFELRLPMVTLSNIYGLEDT